MTISARLVSSGASITVRRAPEGGLQPSQTAVTLKNATGVAGVATQRLDQLLDVTADTALTPAGSTLVYDPATDKYVVKLLNLDGGSF